MENTKPAALNLQHDIFIAQQICRETCHEYLKWEPLPAPNNMKGGTSFSYPDGKEMSL